MLASVLVCAMVAMMVARLADEMDGALAERSVA